ncbi:MAG: hypothetical protein GTO18_20625 [Anaerolineales bacterium]|nr:hypothetical protein [Anaerolineales bacterium]
MFLVFLENIAVIGVILLLGLLISRLILGPNEKMAYLGLAFPLGSGIFTWLVFLTSWFGFPNLKISYVGVTGILLVTLLVLGPPVRFKELWSDLRNWFRGLGGLRELPWLSILLWSLVLLVFLGALVISVGRSYSVWDAVAFWSIKGYGMALENTLDAISQWGSHGMTYPPNISLLISIFKMVTGDILPGSKLLFPLYLLSILIGSYRFWRQIGTRSIVSRIGLLFLVSVPIVFEYGTIGYSNLPLACFLVLALLWGSEGIFFNRWRPQLASGILFGLAAWTRPEGILYGIAGFGALAISSWLMRRGKVNYAALLLPIVVIGGSWLVFYSFHGGGDSQAMSGVGAALRSFRTGDFNLTALKVIGRFIIASSIDIKTWGLVLPLSLVTIIVSFRSRKGDPQPFFWSCLIGSVAFGVVTIGLFYIGQFQFEPGFLQGWLARGFMRALLPTIILLAIACVSSFGVSDEQTSTGNSMR